LCYSSCHGENQHDKRKSNFSKLKTEVQVKPETAPTTSVGILCTFHPAWFAVVMGTGILSVAAIQNPGRWDAIKPIMDGIGVGAALLAYALAVLLGVPYVWRWIRHSEVAWKDLRHPVLGALYATFPAGLLVLAITTASAGPLILSKDIVNFLVTVLAAVGGILAFTISVAFSYILFVTPAVNAEIVTGGWFIPPVVNIILPVALASLLEQAPPDTARLLLVISYAAWGMGFFLFLMVAALIYARLIYHPLPAAHFAPSLWIGLAPIGVGSLGLVRLAQRGGSAWGELGPTVQTISSIGGLMLWGLGLWWLPLAALLLTRYLRNGGLPYGVGWWAFTFPVGSYTVCTLVLGRQWKVDALEWLGVIFFLLLIVFWLVVAIRTLKGIRTGEAWKR
jgi:C4-dicarboxylate transporter/malic acid transport protein